MLSAQLGNASYTWIADGVSTCWTVTGGGAGSTSPHRVTLTLMPRPASSSSTIGSTVPSDRSASLIVSGSGRSRNTRAARSASSRRSVSCAVGDGDVVPAGRRPRPRWSAPTRCASATSSARVTGPVTRPPRPRASRTNRFSNAGTDPATMARALCPACSTASTARSNSPNRSRSVRTARA